jgi:hypothetical protein
MMPRGSDHSGRPKDPEVQKRNAKALKLRQKGYSCQAIYEMSHKQNWTKTFRDAEQVSKRVNKCLADIVREPAKELLEMELARLDALQLALWNQAIKGKVQSTDRILAIMRRRAKLLGLDYADQKPGNDTSDVDQWLKGIDATAPSEDEEAAIAKALASDEGQQVVSDPELHESE